MLPVGKPVTLEDIVKNNDYVYDIQDKTGSFYKSCGGKNPKDVICKIPYVELNTDELVQTDNPNEAYFKVLLTYSHGQPVKTTDAKGQYKFSYYKVVSNKPSVYEVDNRSFKAKNIKTDKRCTIQLVVPYVEYNTIIPKECIKNHQQGILFKFSNMTQPQLATPFKGVWIKMKDSSKETVTHNYIYLALNDPRVSDFVVEITNVNGTFYKPLLEYIRDSKRIKRTMNCFVR